MVAVLRTVTSIARYQAMFLMPQTHVSHEHMTKSENSKGTLTMPKGLSGVQSVVLGEWRTAGSWSPICLRTVG
jgi:hypothetical protein